VLGAVFSLGNCLDLIDKRFLDLVKTTHNIYTETCSKRGKRMPANENPIEAPKSSDRVIRWLDCAVIRRVHEIIYETAQPAFDSVRALFPEGKELYPGAGFQAKTHIQIAIRNPNMIKGYFLPRKEVNWSGVPPTLSAAA
jgi:hypothetical protein